MPETSSEHEKEIYAAQRAIETYRKIPPDIQFGHAPSSLTGNLLSLCEGAGMLSPGERLDHAFLQTEHLLALLADSDAGEASQGDITAARQAAKASFKQLTQDASAPARIRAQAMVAGPSVDLYEDAFMRGTKANLVQGNTYAQLEGIKAAAILMLLEFDEDDTDFMNELSVHALYAECMVGSAWYLPTPSRQPWALTAVPQRREFAGFHIAVSEHEQPGCLTIPPSLLGHGTWEKATAPAFDVLQAYSQYAPGYHTLTKRAPRNRWAALETLRDFMDPIADALMKRNNTYRGNLAPPFGLLDHKPSAPQQSVDESLSPIIEWYANQDAHATVEQMGAEEFADKLHVLETQAAEGALPGRDHQGLAWMQRDYAQHLFETAETPDMARINELLDAAIANCITATEAYKEARLHGNTCDTLFDTESMIVYKAMLNGDPHTTKEAVATYCRKIANLYMFIRDQRQAVKGDREQMLTLAVCVERITIALLLTAATDPEIDHHLALPGRPRASKPGEHIDMMVFTDDAHAPAGYTPTGSVTVRFTKGNEVSFSEGSIVVGRDFLMPGTDRMAVLKKLSAISRDKKGREKRTPAIDALCATLATLVVDADEAAG